MSWVLLFLSIANLTIMALLVRDIRRLQKLRKELTDWFLEKSKGDPK